MSGACVVKFISYLNAVEELVLWCWCNWELLLHCL